MARARVQVGSPLPLRPPRKQRAGRAPGTASLGQAEELAFPTSFLCPVFARVCYKASGAGGEGAPPLGDKHTERVAGRAGRGRGDVYAAAGWLPYLAFPELPIGSGQAGPPRSLPLMELSLRSTWPSVGWRDGKSPKTTKAAPVQTCVPKACPQARPWGVEYCRQPARSSRAGQGAPPFRGSCCTRRLRTRAVGLHWSAQPLQGLQDPTMHGRAEKQRDGAQPGAGARGSHRPRPGPALPGGSHRGAGDTAPLPCPRPAGGGAGSGRWL